jgi:tetratricopeptide (TPR) repeat protein
MMSGPSKALWLSLMVVAACGNDAQSSRSQTSSGGTGSSDAGASGPTTGSSAEESSNPPQSPVVSSSDAGGAEEDASAADPSQSGRPAAPPPRPEMSASARESYRQGLSAAQQGNLAGAREAFDRALAEDSRAFAAAYNAGVIAERQGQEPQADSYYQRALTIQPDYELAVRARAQLLVRQRRANEAVQLAGGIAARFPGNFLVRAEYARLLVVAERYDEAVTEARAILRLDERNIPAKIAVAEAFRARGRLDNALYIIDDVINGSDPNHPNNGPGANDARAHYLRALLRVEVNRDIPGAITSFRRAVELDPQFAEAHNNLGVYLLQAGNVPQAIEHLTAATALSPSWSKAHLNLGDALRAMHRYDEAVSSLQRAQQLEPTLTEVHYNFGRLYGEQAREVPSQGVENLRRKLALLRQAQQAFTSFRDALGPQFAAHPRAADVTAQLDRLGSLITRTDTALQRALRQAARAAAGDAGAVAAPAPNTMDAGGSASRTADAVDAGGAASTDGGSN